MCIFIDHLSKYLFRCRCRRRRRSRDLIVTASNKHLDLVVCFEVIHLAADGWDTCMNVGLGF